MKCCSDEHLYTAHFDEEADRYYWMCINCAAITVSEKMVGDRELN